MAEPAVESVTEIKAVTQTALNLQLRLLRRAWSMYYAAISASMLFSIFVTPTVSAVFPNAFTLPLHVLANVAASGVAVIAILWTFNRVRATAEIRDLVEHSARTRLVSYPILVASWIAIYASVLLVLLLTPFVHIAILAVYVILCGYTYYALRLSFPEGPPMEGILAVSSLAVASLGSVLLTYGLEVRIDAPYVILYGSTILVWGAAAWYARSRSLSGLDGQTT